MKVLKYIITAPSTADFSAGSEPYGHTAEMGLFSEALPLELADFSINFSRFLTAHNSTAQHFTSRFYLKVRAGDIPTPL